MKWTNLSPIFDLEFILNKKIEDLFQVFSIHQKYCRRFSIFRMKILIHHFYPITKSLSRLRICSLVCVKLYKRFWKITEANILMVASAVPFFRSIVVSFSPFVCLSMMENLNGARDFEWVYILYFTDYIAVKISVCRCICWRKFGAIKFSRL